MPIIRLFFSLARQLESRKHAKGHFLKTRVHVLVIIKPNIPRIQRLSGFVFLDLLQGFQTLPPLATHVSDAVLLNIIKTYCLNYCCRYGITRAGIFHVVTFYISDGY